MDIHTSEPYNASLSSSAQVIPLVSVEGSAYDCGREYVEIVQSRYPGYHRYLDTLEEWRNLPKHVETLFDQYAPHIPDIHRGMLAAFSPATGQSTQPAPEEDCTSFGVNGSFTADGKPLSGQNKDTVLQSESLYIVLRMRVTGAPTILVLAYPGEVLGYGMWSTGMTIFRNALPSTADNLKGLSMVQFGLLALSGRSVEEAGELALREGVRNQGNLLLSDSSGKSINVEFNAGGVEVLPAEDGLCVHANHPTGAKTLQHERQNNPDYARNSRLRHQQITSLLAEARGTLTPRECFCCLADHENQPDCLCRHGESDTEDICTTASVVAEPSRGVLHVVRSNPCRSQPVSYSF
jgi:isopenicillin-N N-acyltransferase-like protein